MAPEHKKRKERGVVVNDSTRVNGPSRSPENEYHESEKQKPSEVASSTTTNENEIQVGKKPKKRRVKTIRVRNNNDEKNNTLFFIDKKGQGRPGEDASRDIHSNHDHGEPMVIRKRQRTKTRSKQKNRKKDNRPEGSWMKNRPWIHQPTQE
jgi:hypothetical protein